MDDSANDGQAEAKSGSSDLAFARAIREAILAGSAATVLSTPTPLEQLIEHLVRTAARVIPSPEGALFLVDSERRTLSFDVAIGSTAAVVKGMTIPMGHGIAGLVAVTGQPIAVADAQRDPRHARDIAERTSYFPNSILTVPVVAHDGGIIGVLQLLDRQEQATYSLTDMEHLGRFAEQIAIVLEYRRLVAGTSSLLGLAIASLPELGQESRQVFEDFAASVKADVEIRRILEIAELVAQITARGQSEQKTCLAVLRAFAGYSQSSLSSMAGERMF
jgi:GAF domain-containing protein